MGSVAPPRHTKTATAAGRNVAERSNQNWLVCLIKTYKSHGDTPDLNPIGSELLPLKIT